MRISDMPTLPELSGEEFVPIFDPNEANLSQQNKKVPSESFRGLIGPRGFRGYSAYEIWLNLGNTGTEQDFIDFITGDNGIDGTDGQDGKSAYQIWIELGNSGDESDFIDSLRGASAYQSWLSLGNNGSIQAFLETQRGPQGYSAYEIWRQQGNTGNQAAFITAITGKSAYEVWLANGNTGTVNDFLLFLKGEQGEQGIQGIQGNPGLNGTNGTNGNFFFSGAGTPSTGLGQVNDFYINRNNGDVYQKVSNNNWGSVLFNLKGPQGNQGVQGDQGIQGNQGATGTPGTVWYSGSAVPSNGTGVNGDYYFRTTNGDVYQKVSGSWTGPISNLKGPQGDTGNSATELFSTGDVKLTYKVVPDTGWIMMNDGTIGNASSGASNRAAADVQNLYVLLWNNISQTYAPVIGGRGGSALSDFNAGKRLTLSRSLGRVLGISGTGTGLSQRFLGNWLGEELHQLTVDEMPSHNHGYDDAYFAEIYAGNAGKPGAKGGSDNDNNYYYRSPRPTTDYVGGSQPFNIMQPTHFLNAMIKL